MRKQRILWDMDGVLSDLIGSLIDFLNKEYPDSVYEAKHAITWNFWENLVNREAGKATLKQMHYPGFFLKLKPFPQTLRVIKKIVGLGPEVNIRHGTFSGEF